MFTIAPESRQFGAGTFRILPQGGAVRPRMGDAYAPQLSRKLVSATTG